VSEKKNECVHACVCARASERVFMYVCNTYQAPISHRSECIVPRKLHEVARDYISARRGRCPVHDDTPDAAASRPTWDSCSRSGRDCFWREGCDSDEGWARDLVVYTALGGESQRGSAWRGPGDGEGGNKGSPFVVGELWRGESDDSRHCCGEDWGSGFWVFLE
jgi:hypothetical protein